MGDWTDELLSISEICDASRPLKKYVPSENVKKARSKPSIYEDSSDDDTEYTPKSGGRGYLLQSHNKAPGGKPSFLAHQDYITNQIREVSTIGYSNDFIEKYIKEESSSSSATSSQRTTPCEKDSVTIQPALSDILKNCKRPVRRNASSDVNTSNGCVEIGNTSSRQPMNDRMLFSDNIIDPKPNLNSLKDFPKLN